VKVDDFRKHASQDRYEELVERHCELRGLVVRRAPHVAAVVDRFAAQRQPLDREHGELSLRVVVAGVVTKRAFHRGVTWVDEPFEQDLRTRGGVQARVRAAPDARAIAAQQAREFVFGKRVRNRGDGREHRGRIGADRHEDGKRSVWVFVAPAGVIECAAPVWKPSHDQAIAADQLLPVDRDVLARMPCAARHHEAERDQAPRVLRPAALDRQHAEVDVVAGANVGQEFCVLDRARSDVGQLRELWPRLERGLEARWPARLTHEREQFAQFPQRADAATAERCLDPVTAAEQVAEQSMRRTDRPFEQQRRPARFQGAQAQRGAFQLRIDRLVDAPQCLCAFESTEEAAQVVKCHGVRSAKSARIKRPRRARQNDASQGHRAVYHRRFSAAGATR
jgi:hypothetical protein